MTTSPRLMGWLVAGMGALAPWALPAEEGANSVPVIPPHDFSGGSAKVKVTGSFVIDAIIPINAEASIGDGEMTWLQYGDSGAETPNFLVTVSTWEIGLGPGLGKQTATAGAADCAGKMTVKATAVNGHYRCLDVTSYDPRTGQMGKVNIEIEFTAN